MTTVNGRKGDKQSRWRRWLAAATVGQSERWWPGAQKPRGCDNRFWVAMAMVCRNQLRPQMAGWDTTETNCSWAAGLAANQTSSHAVNTNMDHPATHTHTPHQPFTHTRQVLVNRFDKNCFFFFLLSFSTGRWWCQPNHCHMIGSFVGQWFVIKIENLLWRCVHVNLFQIIFAAGRGRRMFNLMKHKSDSSSVWIKHQGLIRVYENMVAQDRFILTVTEKT